MFSEHSTRGAAASKAFASGIPVERILKAGNWATESVFSKHYQRPVVEAEPDGLAIVEVEQLTWNCTIARGRVATEEQLGLRGGSFNRNYSGGSKDQSNRGNRFKTGKWNS
ncbi:hypothetical protein OUZ56_029982 [Daphnia magna]|uniref:Ndc10 domain-containing protein n=1 Tax=Daphnia magna TaxID=35525 RepID=A0ABR0B8E1_9CRUS|nr:hypothetical protein OUZ56_029982 [Daphnia magna]